MRWIESINNIQLTIITGDGQEYRPTWIDASSSINYNPTKFDFINISGTLVKRGEHSSPEYDFQIIFDGENCLEEMEQFRVSSMDPRPWTIVHPAYPKFKAHPSIQNYNTSSQNIVIVTGTIFETIEDEFPESIVDLKQTVIEGVELSIEASAQNYADELGEATPGTTTSLNLLIDKTTEKYKLSAVSDIDFQTIQNRSNDTLAALDNITEEPILFGRQVLNLLRTPANNLDRVKQRLKTLSDTYNDINDTILFSLTRQKKLFFEAGGAAILAAKCEAAVLPISEISEIQDIKTDQVDYKTRNEVLEVIRDIHNNLNSYFEKLGELQTDNASTLNSYIPSRNTIRKLKDVVGKTTANLLQIAVGAKQQRTYEVPKNIGIVSLSYRLLGTVNNLTIQDLANDNDISLDEILIIKKGRKIKYYV